MGWLEILQPLIIIEWEAWKPLRVDIAHSINYGSYFFERIFTRPVFHQQQLLSPFPAKCWLKVPLYCCDPFRVFRLIVSDLTWALNLTLVQKGSLGEKKAAAALRSAIKMYCFNGLIHERAATFPRLCGVGGIGCFNERRKALSLHKIWIISFTICDGVGLGVSRCCYENISS